MAIARALLEDLSNNWWVILLRGIVGVIFGVVAFVSPGATLLALVFVWGAYALIDGAFALRPDARSLPDRPTARRAARPPTGGDTRCTLARLTPGPRATGARSSCC